MEPKAHELELSFVRATLREWKDLPPTSIIFERLSGISNVVYKVSTPEPNVQPNPLILRQFSKAGVVDRDKEAYIFEELGKLGLGPKSYGSNEDYRLEEYFHSRVIQPKEVNQKNMRRKLARALGQLHRVDFPKLDKTGLFVKLLDDQAYYGKFNDKCNQNIFTAEEGKFIEIVRQMASKEELDFIKKCLPEEDAVFCHNDLLCNNILVMNSTSDVCFVDVEYGNYNFRGFDIGNLLSESMFDYTVTTSPYYRVNEENFPSEDDIVDFVRYYLVCNEMDAAETTNEVLDDEQKFSELEARLSESDPSEYKSLVDNLVKQIKVGSMLSHYYWCVWAIIMSKNPDIDFDYILFAKDRYDQYQKFKTKLLKQDQI